LGDAATAALFRTRVVKLLGIGPSCAQTKLRAFAGEAPITARLVESMTDSDRALAASAMRDVLAIAA
jgi:hypothetical protein